jgi:peptidoglycan/LPS O-acetylase OafA/YrhL
MHAFMLLVFVLVTWAVARMGILLMSPQSTEWSDLVRALLLVHAWDSVERYPWNGPSWSISAEWVAYVVFPLLATVAVKIRNAAIAVALVVLLYVLYRLLGHHPSEHLGIAWRMPHLFANFFAGVLLWRLASLTPATRHDDKIAAFALVLLTLGASASNLLAMKPVAGDRFAIVAALLVYFTARSTGPLARFLSTRAMLHLGRISYSLYLVHMLFMYGSDIFIRRAPEMAWPIRIAAVGLALLTAHLCYRWIEEPCRKAIVRARPPALAVGAAPAT